MKYALIVVLGPTAVGKTRLACHLSKALNGELISADSRQVYRKMDIGTGKDLSDFLIGDFKVPYHLIDIKDAGEAYNVFEFQRDFLAAFQTISKKNKPTLLCGGTGMYLSAALQKEKIVAVPLDQQLRNDLEKLSEEELIDRLKQLKKLHNTSDSLDPIRLIRAIEIAEYEKKNPQEPMPSFPKIIIGIKADRSVVKENIHRRLKDRLTNGMIEEVEQLIESGVTHEQLNYYGLEYRFISLFLRNEIDKNQLFTELYKAICNYAKRQMTWYRRMEKQGIQINWIDGTEPLDSQIKSALNIIANA